MVKGSPNKGVSTERPFSLFVVPMKQGVSTAFATTFGSNNKAAFVFPIIQRLQNNPSEAAELNVSEICFRRSANQDNNRMPSSPTSAYGFYQFIRVFESEEDSTHQKNVEWGKLLARKFTEFANDYQYPKTFSFVRTPSTGLDLPTVDKCLLNEDVIKVMDTIYPTNIYSRQQQAESVGADFFQQQ